MTRRKPAETVEILPPLPDEPGLTLKLDKLAAQIAEELAFADTPMDEKISGLRALTAYYQMIHRLPPPPDEKAGKFGGFTDALKKNNF